MKKVLKLNKEIKINIFINTFLKGCLTLQSNGRVVPVYGVDCNQSLPTVCEHQVCYTHQGFECIFPFVYKNITYRNCSSQDVYKPWCPTGKL